MPSADFCTRIPTPLDAGSLRQPCRPPWVRGIHLHAYAHRIYVHALRAGWLLGERLATFPRADDALEALR